MALKKEQDIRAVHAMAAGNICYDQNSPYLIAFARLTKDQKDAVAKVMNEKVRALNEGEAAKRAEFAAKKERMRDRKKKQRAQWQRHLKLRMLSYSKS